MYKMYLGKKLKNKFSKLTADQFLRDFKYLSPIKLIPNIAFEYFAYNLVLLWKLYTLKFDVQVASKMLISNWNALFSNRTYFNYLCIIYKGSRRNYSYLLEKLFQKDLYILFQTAFLTLKI